MSICLCISSTHIPCHVAHRGSEVNFQEPVLTFPLVEARSPISTAVLLILGWIWSILTILLSSHSISKECWDHRCMPLYQAYKVGFRDQTQIMGLAQLAPSAAETSPWSTRFCFYACSYKFLCHGLDYFMMKVSTSLFIHNKIVLQTRAYRLTSLYHQGESLNKSFE